MDKIEAQLMYPNGGKIAVKKFDELGTDILMSALEAGKMQVLTDGKIAFVCAEDALGERRAYVYSVGTGEDHFICQYVSINRRCVLKTMIYW